MTSYVLFEMPVRASRLLRLLLLLQSRGRLTSAALAAELEVVPRTILRDVDALTEAGFPVIVHRGSQGGVELGFNYRIRLTGLTADEAEALSVMLRRSGPELAALGLTDAGRRAREKLIASLPEALRNIIASAEQRFRFDPSHSAKPDRRVAALASAIRGAKEVTFRRGAAAVELRPIALVYGAAGWCVLDARPDRAPVALSDIGAITISARSFAGTP